MIKLEVAASPEPLVTLIVPALMVVTPVKVFAPPSVSVFAPVFVRPPAPEATPLRVILPEAAFNVRVVAKLKAVLRVWRLLELLVMSPVTARAVPPLAPADPALAASV